ncbi:sigma-70 family RNA polymerase sigma factor [Leptospira sp. 96542]|nr:sigma-70 family RNA polymerase sigma factor [Leptospira sp. 96542]
MNRYQAMVYSQAKKAFLTQEEAEDFTQEVFLQAFESLSQFRGEAQFSTWIFQIARFKLSKQFKKKKVVTEPWLDEIYAIPETKQESIVETIHKEDRHRSLRDLITKLPKSYQLPIILHFFENKPLKEISSELNIKLNTIKSNIARGKELLRKWWAHEID